MSRIYIRTNNKGITNYYADIRIDGTRTRKFLASNPKSAKLALKKLEYQPAYL